jgi:hypothetical protein
VHVRCSRPAMTATVVKRVSLGSLPPPHTLPQPQEIQTLHNVLVGYAEVGHRLTRLVTHQTSHQRRRQTLKLLHSQPSTQKEFTVQ